jgi:hypothetical protein
MNDFVPLPAAVEEIAARSAVTPTAARKALIATFITRRAVAICDAYWRTATVGGRALQGPAPDESAVPADFWHLDHANLSRDDGWLVPSGYLGKWNDTANFQSEICLSAEWAADRYPEFPDLRHLGGRPVEFQTCAMDVRICSADIDALVERGKTPRQFEALLKEARRKASIAQGNLSKSDSERLWARLCCNFLTLSQQWEIASNPDKILERVRSTCSRVSEDEQVSDRMMRRIADLIADEAQRLARRRSLQI